MRWLTVLPLALSTSCLFARPIEGGCLYGRLDVWCHHNEGAEGPTSQEICLPPSSEEAEPHPTLDYLVTFEEGGTTTEIHYFSKTTGAHVATAYWSSTTSYCGCHYFWYGRQIELDPVGELLDTEWAGECDE